MKTIPNKLNQNFIKMKKRFIKNHQKTKRRYDHANKVQKYKRTILKALAKGS